MNDEKINITRLLLCRILTFVYPSENIQKHPYRKKSPNQNIKSIKSSKFAHNIYPDRLKKYFTYHKNEWKNKKITREKIVDVLKH